MDSGVAVELIATQSELAALVTAARRGEDGDGLRVTDGWRRELVGDELRELLAGRRRLGVGPDRTLRVSEGEPGADMINRKLLGIYLNDHLAGVHRRHGGRASAPRARTRAPATGPSSGSSPRRSSRTARASRTS